MYINVFKTKILNRSVHFIINFEFIDLCVVPRRHKYDLGIENMVQITLSQRSEGQ